MKKPVNKKYSEAGDNFEYALEDFRSRLYCIYGRPLNFKIQFHHPDFDDIIFDFLGKQRHIICWPSDLNDVRICGIRIEVCRKAEL